MKLWEAVTCMYFPGENYNHSGIACPTPPGGSFGIKPGAGYGILQSGPKPLVHGQHVDWESFQR